MWVSWSQENRIKKQAIGKLEYSYAGLRLESLIA
jgi:hypothetical protein